MTDALPPVEPSPVEHADSADDAEMNLIDHLVELRARILHSLLAFFAVTLMLMPFSAQLHSLVVIPLQQALPQHTQMVATGAMSPFLAPFKLSIYTALAITIPYMLFQLWAFVAPGLYRHEKILYGTVLLASILLFYCGMAFVYFAVFPMLYHFMGSIQLTGVIYMPDISDNLDLMFKLFFAFGVAFEVPVVTFVLIRAGIVSAEKMASLRRYIIVLCFAVAMILTPPDVLSQIMMAVPMCLLFELGLLLGKVFKPVQVESRAE